MSTTFVVRVAETDPSTGRLVGLVEAVASGAVRQVRTASELIAFLDDETATAHSHLPSHDDRNR